MDVDENLLLEKFLKLRTWANGDKRSVHKPLLILFALGQLQAGQERLLYKDVDSPLGELLKRFGPYRKTNHTTTYPFWRLQNDDIWELTNAENVTASKGDDAKKSELIKLGVEGGFKPEAVQVFRKNTPFLYRIANELLAAHFPETWHKEILEAVGLQFNYDQYSTVRNKRDPEFRTRVLIAYQYGCAVCGESLQIRDVWPTLEAAHIKWHRAKGPDIESNGLALCSTHHRLFDWGAFTLDEKNRLIASEEIHGNGVDDLILRYHGTVINKPIKKLYIPESKYIDWHRKEVFRGNSR